MLFQYWRGDLIYTFKFVTSVYHKGRVRITWDPAADINADSVSTSVAFTQIVDISETNEVEIRVPYLQRTTWLQTRAADDSVKWSTSPTPTYTHDPTYSNGYIQMRVLTELSAPTTTSTINVLTYIRCADDIEFSAPTPLINDLVMYTPQTSEETYYLQSGETDLSKLVVGKQTKPDEHRFHVYMGENIKSIRQLLRRTNYNGALNFPVSTTDIWSIANFKQNMYPLMPGFDPNGIHTAVGFAVETAPYNFVPNTVFGLIAPMFVGMRGSMIWDYNVDTPTSDYVSSLTVNRLAAPISAADYYNFSLAHDNEKNNTSRSFSGALLPGPAGGCITNQITQSGISASVPFYNQYRFVSTAPLDRTLGNTSDGSHILTHSTTVITHPSHQTLGNAGYLLQKYFKVGSDFNLFMFLNCPSLIDQGGIPAAAP